MATYGGIDLGGTKIQTAIVDEQRKVLGSARRPTPTSGGPADVASAMEGALRDAASEAGVRPEALAGVGVGSPGTIEGDTVTSARLPFSMSVSVLQASSNWLGSEIEQEQALLRHVSDRVARPLAADAAVLDAAVGKLVGAPGRAAVDDDAAGPDSPVGPQGDVDGLREYAALEAEPPMAGSLPVAAAQQGLSQSVMA